MDEIIVLQALYALLLQNKSSRVSLVRLQTEINENHLLSRLVPSTGNQVLSVHDILETIKRLFPKQTSLTEGQITFYNLQLAELREMLFEMYHASRKRLQNEIHALETRIDPLLEHKATSQRTRLLELCRDTLLNKFQDHGHAAIYEELVENSAIKQPLNLDGIRTQTPTSILELQAWLQLCVANTTLLHRTGSPGWKAARASQKELEETIAFVRSVLE
ncbi:LAMI_0H07008g1_1 [Lachancea mirantina]|uniref:LAMI_0H07008g1_1 n=1 Tax=Lachancea mirantina TaxID=1230905 RepID=A0A1G4KFM8_9SACH|nr:LAMI_0H07008g1_1 [Lachancea mirantina]